MSDQLLKAAKAALEMTNCECPHCAVIKNDLRAAIAAAEAQLAPLTDSEITELAAEHYPDVFKLVRAIERRVRGETK